MKYFIIKKANQGTFMMYLETVTKMMNKEDRNSHLLSVKLWGIIFLRGATIRPKEYWLSQGRIRM
jgi:hypothetical protein